MAVFNAKNQRFLLCCMIAVLVLYILYMLTVYSIYYNSEEFSEDLWKRVDDRSELFGYVMMILSCLYFYSCGSGRKATLDFPMFYSFVYPFNAFYCAFRYKGLFKGLVLIIFWIVAFLVPLWTDYLVYTWTYWNYESP